MKSDKPLYLVSSHPRAKHAVRSRASHLRLVQPVSAGPAVSVVRPVPARSRPGSLSRSFGQRMLQAASDVAVLAVALIVGLRPNA
jgi:hypothetical protein